MTTEESSCSVCGKSFVPELAFQVEERKSLGPNGEQRTEVTYYCSLDCVSQSHESAGRAECDICSRAFPVELVSQVINHRGRRHHACSATCRQQLLERLHGPSLRAQPPTSIPRGEESIPDGEAPSSPANSTRPPLRLQSLPGGRPPNAMGSRSAPPSSPNTTLRPTAESNTKSAGMIVDNDPSEVTWRRIEATLNGRTQVLAVFNHKGGTGKTTTAVTVAAGLANKGRRVLLVDTDGQGNVGVSLGMQNEKTLYHVLVMGLDPHEAIVEMRPNLHVLPANETLAAAELFLAGRQRRDRVLASRLAPLRNEYDAIIVDCSPSLSLLNQNALVFADGVLCPVACDYLSIVGVRQVLRTIKQVNRLLSHPVRLWGVLPTLYDARARVCVEAYDTLRQHFGDRCLSPIRVASRAKEAPSQAQTLFEYAPDATATKDYWQVVEQLFRDTDRSQENGLASVAGGAK